MSASWKQLVLQTFLLLVSCRHINTKTPGPTAPPLPPVSPLPTETKSFVLTGETHTEKVELFNQVNLTLRCTWTGNVNKPANITGYWKKDGEEIKASRLTVQLENEQYKLSQSFMIVNEETLGNYSCVFGKEASVDFVLAVPQMGDIRDKPIVSYVGDSVVITCKMEDAKPQPVSWNWYKDNGTEKEQIVVAAEPRRYEIKNEERKAKLVVNNLTAADSGLYYCEAVYAISTSMSHMELKVITLWEPLKPFLAIVVEVIVLVAAILLYEKSQSKKNCAEGNGTVPDQTNTLTQGESNGAEESSSVRQRKV